MNINFFLLFIRFLHIECIDFYISLNLLYYIYFYLVMYNIFKFFFLFIYRKKLFITIRKSIHDIHFLAKNIFYLITILIIYSEDGQVYKKKNINLRQTSVDPRT